MASSKTKEKLVKKENVESHVDIGISVYSPYVQFKTVVLVKSDNLKHHHERKHHHF